MIAPAMEHVRSVYDGRQCLGYIAIIGDGFHAELLDGHVIGLFSSQHEASDAISAATGRKSAGDSRHG